MPDPRALEKRIAAVAGQIDETRRILGLPEVTETIRRHLKAGRATPDVAVMHDDHPIGLLVRFIKHGDNFVHQWRHEDWVPDGHVFIASAGGDLQPAMGGNVRGQCLQCHRPLPTRRVPVLIGEAIVALDTPKHIGRKFVRL